VGWAPVARTIQPNGDALDEKPLVLHSERDAVTPIAGAFRVAEALGGTLVTVGGGDHGTFRNGNDAVDALVMQFLETGIAAPGHIEGKPSPDPLPRWGQAERAAAAQQGLSAPIAGADDWYGTDRVAGSEPAAFGSVSAPAPAPVQPAPAALLPTPEQLHQQAEKALQDVAGQVDAAVRTLFTPPVPQA